MQTIPEPSPRAAPDRGADPTTRPVPPTRRNPEVDEGKELAAIRKAGSGSIFQGPLVRAAIWESFRKLDPRAVAKNPVMFVVEIGATITTVVLLEQILTSTGNVGFTLQITLWLWFTVLFANFAEAMAEARGKAQADTLRATKKDTPARRLRAGREETVSSSELRKGDIVLVRENEIIPGDRNARGEPRRRFEHAPGLAQRHGELGRELQSMPAHGRVECLVRKGQPLDVHHLEPGVGNVGGDCHLDHPRREINTDHLTVGRNLFGETPAQRTRPACEVQHAHAGLRIDELEDPQASPGLAPRHHLLDALLVGDRVASEDCREQLLRFHSRVHGARFCHSRSSQRAALRVSPLVRPTTCIPTGSPRTGAGSATTG